MVSVAGGGCSLDSGGGGGVWYLLHSLRWGRGAGCRFKVLTGCLRNGGWGGKQGTIPQAPHQELPLPWQNGKEAGEGV